MPFFIRVCETCIYPGTTQFNFSIHVNTLTQTRELSMPNQWARSCQLSMSTQILQLVNYQCQTTGTITSAINVNQILICKLSVPNQCAQSRQLSMSTQTLTGKLSMPNQRAQTRQLSMSIRTLAGKLSMPNQCAQSCQLSMSTQTLTGKLSMPNINAKPMDTLSSAIDVNWTLACKLSFINQWAQSPQLVC